jgi:hypothetical protein
MNNTKKLFTRIGIVAGLITAMANAYAWTFDAQITIDRAVNSPTLTVRYSGATNVALVELRINGQSVGTRSVAASKAAGETNFNLDLSALNDGDNEVEVRLLDKSGKVVSAEKSFISTDDQSGAPVYLATPKMGATVLGPVEIKVGFGRNMRDTYVSFFIDNQFKSLKNVPPFNYIWDTSSESNGWHELEAWVIDESSTTFKTRKVRVFVNNPSGRTNRQPAVTPVKTIDLTPAANTVKAGVVGNAVGIKSVAAATTQAVGVATVAKIPKVSATLAPNQTKVNSSGAVAGTKSATIGSGVATGVRDLTPTGTRNALQVAKATAAPTLKVDVQPITKVDVKPIPKVDVKPTTAPVVKVAQNATAVATTIAISKGQRLPNIGSYAIVFNTSMVNFDVQPRVEDGIPMTPFRHLIEKAGGTVDWEGIQKAIEAKADGKEIFIQIGSKVARINKIDVSLEMAPYIERGRTIVPLSFIKDTLNVEIEYDKATGHVLIKSKS